MLDLGNCDRCGAVFAKGLRDICQECHKAEEADFKVVYQFLIKRQNREATLQEVVDATEVDKDLIVKFIKQKRLRTSQFQMLAYGCEKCGRDINEGRLCESCSTQIKSDIKSHENIEALKQRSLERDEREQTFYTQRITRK